MESEPEKASLSCICNWLHDAAANPEMPITFNAERNEFQLHAGSTIYSIYYCPFCRGRVPKSLRDTFFAIISSEEQQHISPLAEGITSYDDALRVFGPPDQDRHSLTYRTLSETANVVALFINGEWRGVFQTRKNIRPKISIDETRNAEA